jgi:hypothetical protein
MNSYERNTGRQRAGQRGRLGKAIPVWLLVVTCVAIGAGAAAGTVLAGGITGVMPMAVSQAILVDGLGFGVDDVTFASGNPTNRANVAVADDTTGFQVATEIAVGDKFIISMPVKNASNNPMVGLITLDPSTPAGLQFTVSERSLLALTHVTAPPEDAAARGAPLGTGQHTYNTRYWPLADANGDGIVDPSDIIPAVTGGAGINIDAVNALMGTITYTITGVPATSFTLDYWYGSEITIVCQVGPNQWKFQADGTVGTNHSGDIEIIVADPDDLPPGYYHISGTVEQIEF